MSGILKRCAFIKTKKKGDTRPISKVQHKKKGDESILKDELANHEEDGWLVYEVKSLTVLDPPDQTRVQEACALQDGLKEADKEQAQSALDNAGIPKRTEDTSENKWGESAGNKKVDCTTDKEENGYDDSARASETSSETRDNDKVDVLEVDSLCNAVEPMPAIESTKGNESNESEVAKNYRDQVQTGGEHGTNTKSVADSQTHKKDANRDEEKSTEDAHQSTARESDQVTGVPITPDTVGDHTGKAELSAHENSQADNETGQYNGKVQCSHGAKEKQPMNFKDATTGPTHPPRDLSSEKQPAQFLSSSSWNITPCTEYVPKAKQACLPDASTDSLANGRAKSPSPQEELVWIIPEVMYKDGRLTMPLRQLADRVNKQLEIRPLPSSSITVEHVGKVLLPFVAVSRLAGDVHAAVHKAKLKVPAVVLIYNHLAPHMSTIRTATKDRLSDRKLVDSCQDMVDVVFWNGNLYDCDANTKAVQRLRAIWNISD